MPESIKEIRNAVYLTELEQEEFVRSIKYQMLLKELENINFPSIKGGSIEIHKDRHGNVSAIIVHTHYNLH